MKRRSMLSMWCVALVVSLTATAQEPKAIQGDKSVENQNVESQLKETMLENMKSTEAEDLTRTMKTVHSKSPLHQSSRIVLSQLFGKHMNLKYELLSFKYLTTDGDYAIARVLQRTTQSPHANFQNSEVDMIVAFRKEASAWKFWNQAVLEFKHIKH
jgi:hypothetical protein